MPTESFGPDDHVTASCAYCANPIAQGAFVLVAQEAWITAGEDFICDICNREEPPLVELTTDWEKRFELLQGLRDEADEDHYSDDDYELY